MTLFVTYVPETGHVVGAVNANGVTPQLITNPDGSTSVDPTWLVGTAVLMRGVGGAGEFASVSVPAGGLEVHTPDDEPDVFHRLLLYAVELVGTTPQPALVLLPTWSDRLEFVGTGLHVTLPEPATKDTNVVAWISDGDKTRKASETITKGAKETTLRVNVGTGPHGVLVHVAGLASRLEEVTSQ